MRDLYKRIGVKPDSTQNEIEAAVKRCESAALKKDIEEVLLVPERRVVYDKLHATLTQIGDLRARLGLNHGENWVSSGVDDFTQESVQPVSPLNALHEKLKDPWKSRYKTKPADSYIESLSKSVGVIAIISLFFVFIWLSTSPGNEDAFSSNEMSSDSYKRAEGVPEESKFDKPSIPFPDSGQVKRFSSREALAPLQIRTSGNAKYLVKLESSRSSQRIMDIYLRGGDSVKVDVPLGTYNIKYASGRAWYGREDLFGPNTTYNKADKVFTFAKEDMRYTGYTITLFQVSGGNLRTKQIAPSDF